MRELATEHVALEEDILRDLLLINLLLGFVWALSVVKEISILEGLRGALTHGLHISHAAARLNVSHRPNCSRVGELADYSGRACLIVRIISSSQLLGSRVALQSHFMAFGVPCIGQACSLPVQRLGDINVLLGKLLLAERHAAFVTARN